MATATWPAGTAAPEPSRQLGEPVFGVGDHERALLAQVGAERAHGVLFAQAQSMPT
jgi:hypothetical protein